MARFTVYHTSATMMPPVEHERISAIDAEIRPIEPGKSSAYLVNTAQGPVVDQAALAESLQTGGIAGAGPTSSSRIPFPRTAPCARWTTSSSRRTRPTTRTTRRES
jgi:hypothetical protein